jgi:hypothetical protein
VLVASVEPMLINTDRYVLENFGLTLLINED